MASHTIDTATGLLATAPSRTAELKRRFQAWREQRRRRNQITRELLSYTDRELFDLGISRADIPAVIAGTFRR